MFNKEFSENEKEYLDQKFKQLTEDFMSGRLIIPSDAKKLSEIKNLLSGITNKQDAILGNQKAIIDQQAEILKQKKINPKKLAELFSDNLSNASHPLKDSKNDDPVYDYATAQWGELPTEEKVKPRLSAKELAKELRVSSRLIGLRTRKAQIMPKKFDHSHNIFGEWRRGNYEYMAKGKPAICIKLQFYFSDYGIEKVKELIKE